MFSISEFDAAMLAREVTLPTIEFLLEMMGNGNLPLLAHAKESVESRGDISFGTKVPHNVTARHSVKLREPSLDADVQISTDASGIMNCLQCFCQMFQCISLR